MVTSDMTRRINIIFNTQYRKAGLEKFVAGSDRARKSMKMLADKSRIGYSQIGSKLNQVNVAIDKQGKMWDLTTGKQMKQRSAINRLNQANRRFRMEWLGIMFAGMAMQRMFGQWTQGAKDMTGISELFGATMTLITLQGLMPFLDTIYASILGLMNLDDTTKRTLGTFMLLGEAFGGFLAFAGQLILAFSSLAMVFPPLRTAAIAGISAILGMLTPVMGKVFGSIEGFEGLQGALEAVGAGLTGLAAYEAVRTVQGVLNIESAKTGEGLGASAEKSMFAAPIIGKAFMGIIGSYFIYSGLIQMSNATVTEGVIDDLLAQAQLLLGSSFVGNAIAGPKGAIFGTSIALFASSFFVDDNMIAEMERVLGAAGIVYMAGGWQVSVGLIIGWGITKLAEETGKFFSEWQRNKAAGVVSGMQRPSSMDFFNQFFKPTTTLIGMQHGGIVTSPTLGMIGEAGPEAVIPLDKAGDYFNTTFAPTINITAGSNLDIEVLKSQLSNEWRDELNSMMRSR